VHLCHTYYLLFCVDDCLVCIPGSHPKHAEKRNKHTRKNRASSWLYVQDYTGMHGQQNIKKGFEYSISLYLNANITVLVHVASYLPV
jgi:hypothetical protein